VSENPNKVEGESGNSSIHHPHSLSLPFKLEMIIALVTSAMKSQREWEKRRNLNLSWNLARQHNEAEKDKRERNYKQNKSLL